MAHAGTPYSVAVTADGVPLKVKLRRAERRSRLRAYLLILPLFLFLVLTFFAPIGLMLHLSFTNPVVAGHFPATLARLEGWDAARSETPPEAAYAAFADELHRSVVDQSAGRVATRLNYDQGGAYSLLMKTSRQLARAKEEAAKVASWKDFFLDVDPRWGERDIWGTLRSAGRDPTLSFYLAALDFRYDPAANVVPVPEERRIYVTVFVRTIWISLLVTAICLVLGYPVAHLLASLPTATGNLLMIMVLLPFWTSLLVRITAWMVILQGEGLVNSALRLLHLSDKPIQLIFNRFGLVVAMTHVLLPFMVLPIYSVMRTISPSYRRAGESLGASPTVAFWRVYFPLTLPGIGAGALLVFILALGYYITPALVGGPADQMISYFIVDHTNRSLNWGLASALGVLLLGSVLAMYLVYDRVVGIDKMRLG
jgi:putative spermidine/putrescine transport system permease protein